MQAAHLAGLLLGRGRALVPNLGLGIPPGSKTAPEKGMEEEIN